MPITCCEGLLPVILNGVRRRSHRSTEISETSVSSPLARFCNCSRRNQTGYPLDPPWEGWGREARKRVWKKEEAWKSDFPWSRMQDQKEESQVRENVPEVRPQRKNKCGEDLYDRQRSISKQKAKRKKSAFQLYKVWSWSKADRHQRRREVGQKTFIQPLRRGLSMAEERGEQRPLKANEVDCKEVPKDRRFQKILC